MMPRPGPSVQVTEAVAALKALGFQRQGFQVRASNRRGVYGPAVVTFLTRPEQVLPRVEDLAAAGFNVREITRGAQVVCIVATWIGLNRRGLIRTFDLAGQTEG